MANDVFDPGLGRPHHSGYVVESIEATVERLVEQFGAGPFLLVENVPLEAVTSRGEPAQFKHDSAFGSCGGYPIELLQVARAAPERVETRLSGPLPRIHHVGYALAQAAAEEVRNRFEESGLESYLSSRLNGEYTTVHDASATLGHDIEILVDAPAFRDFFGMVLGAAEGWDGSEPLRPLG
jgi:methylmalonyl-CoA/ethylmalonyl-CoA epimerase